MQPLLATAIELVQIYVSKVHMIKTAYVQHRIDIVTHPSLKHKQPSEFGLVQGKLKCCTILRQIFWCPLDSAVCIRPSFWGFNENPKSHIRRRSTITG